MEESVKHFVGRCYPIHLVCQKTKKDNFNIEYRRYTLFLQLSCVLRFFESGMEKGSSEIPIERSQKIYNLERRLKYVKFNLALKL